MNFDPKKVYEFDLTNQLKFGKISQQRLIDVFNDGRILGLLCGALIADSFNNLTLIENPSTPYDITLNQARRIIRFECKTQASDGYFDLSPSNMKGKGRKFDRKLFDEWLSNDVDEIMLVKRDDFPKLRLITIETSELPVNKKTGLIKYKINLSEFNRLAETGNRKIIKVN